MSTAISWISGQLDDPPGCAVAAQRFWRAVTGSAASEPDGAVTTLVPPGGDPYLRLRVVADPPVRHHLDLHTADVPRLVRRAEGLGAQRAYGGDGPLVCRSPAGLLFRLVRWAGERVRPRPFGAGLVDQMCLDVPAASFEAEAAFWVGLTGWQRRRTDLPEFDFLVRPDGMPLRLLLQRTGGDTAGMHLDLACDDVAAEVSRHEALGASVLRRVPGQWTTLRDPAGRAYCVTARPAR